MLVTEDRSSVTYSTGKIPGMSDTKDQDDETTIKRFDATAMLAELRQVVAETKHGAPGYLTLRVALDLCEHLIADRRIDERLFTEGMLAQAMAKVTRAKIALRYLNREAPKDLIDLDQTDTVSALAEEHARRLDELAQPLDLLGRAAGVRRGVGREVARQPRPRPVVLDPQLGARGAPAARVAPALALPVGRARELRAERLPALRIGLREGAPVQLGEVAQPLGRRGRGAQPDRQERAEEEQQHGAILSR